MKLCGFIAESVFTFIPDPQFIRTPPKVVPGVGLEPTLPLPGKGF
jgi:hypothetical protein